ncbi:MAG: signal peptidase I [Firmicutes bacterium]|nr:signal peptidase I [Bacillota bacterium]
MNKKFYNVNKIHFEKIFDPTKSLRSDLRFVLVLLSYIVVALVIVPVFFYEVVGVKGSSMFPTIHDGDKVGVCKVSGFTYGDIVVIYKPDISESEYIIKRVMALEGDKIWQEKDTETGKYYIHITRTINGESETEILKDEPYINEPMKYITSQEFTVSKDCIFVLGDNRNHSTDSFSFGEVKKSTVLGKVITIMTKSNFGFSIGELDFYWYDTKFIP